MRLVKDSVRRSSPQRIKIQCDEPRRDEPSGTTLQRMPTSSSGASSGRGGRGGRGSRRNGRGRARGRGGVGRGRGGRDFGNVFIVHQRR